MKALRIVLSQNAANYKKEEAVDNKMTYPLPPMSTVIGALYSACGYTREQNTDKIDIKIGIQGKFGSMQREVYRDHAFLNSVMNDRGILVKLKNKQLLSNSFDIVAKSKASQGNDFEKEITIDVVNRKLLDEYKSIRVKKRSLEQQKKDEVNPILKELTFKIKKLKEDVKKIEKGSSQANEILESINELTIEKNNVSINFLQEKEAVDQQYELFASLTTSIKNYEVLYDVELVLHILSDEKTMEDIKNNAYNIKSLGRSEDFVDVKSVEYVELSEEVNDVKSSSYSAYLPCEAIKNYTVMVNDNEGPGGSAQGTKYYMNKIYTIENNKRIFQKKWVMYVDKYFIDYDSQLGIDSGIFYDDKYIVALI